MKALLVTVMLAAMPVAAQPTPPAPPHPPMVRVLRGGSFLGVGVAEIDSERAKKLNLREEHGVEITSVEDDSPAQKAGLKTADVVLEYNGQRVEGTEQFVRLVRETPAGRQVKLLVWRGGSTQTIAPTIGARSSRARGGETRRPPFDFPNFEIHLPDMPKAYMSWSSSMLGVVAESVESQLAEYFGVKEGVLVRSVVKGSAADKAGIKAGDVIVKVDGSKVVSPREVSSAVRSRPGKTFPLTVVRDRKETTLNVTIEEGRPSGGQRRAVPIVKKEDQEL